jgi:HSP20 family protein
MLTVRLSPFDLDPVQHINRMAEQLSRAFGDNLPAGPMLNRSGFPTLNAWQDEQAFYVEAEIPGLGLEDLEITLPEADLVSVKGQRKAPAPESAQWLRRERACGTFEREFRLPGPVAVDDVEAALKNGVLTVKL